MTWTILILVLAILLYVFGGMLLKHDAKKPAAGKIICKKSLKVVAIILIAGAVCRLWTPYYLTNVNPIILQEMVTNMQEQQQEEANKGIRTYVRDHMDEMVADAPVLGNPSAKKTIFVFSAASCGYCRRVHNELTQVIDERDDVRVVIKNFSIHGMMSDIPARATIAAKLQGNDKAAALDTEIMTNEYYTQDDVKDQASAPAKITANIMKMAKKVGLDTERLEKDMNGEVVARELAQVRDLANRFQITGTPFLIIGDQAFPGAIPYDQIMSALDK